MIIVVLLSDPGRVWSENFLTLPDAANWGNMSCNEIMPKRYFLFFGLLLSSQIVWAQTFNKKYFTNTSWFSNNNDTNFYMRDTLKLIKYSNLAPKWAQWTPGRKYYAENASTHLNTGELVELRFESRGKMELLWRERSYKYIIPYGLWTWTFDEKNNVLSFHYSETKSVFSFRPISEKQIKIESSFAEHDDLLTTTELTVIRVR